ncbi:MAG: hypothetical protein ACRDHZ_12225, partial [Ktedonobacteraceae bacterium]
NRAYRIARENGNFMSVFQEATMNPLQAKEAGEVAGMVEDMLVIMGDIQKTLIRQFLHGADPINYLDVNNFKSHSHIAHNRFMSAADKSFMDGGSSTKNDSTIKLDHINKITCIRPKDNGKKYQAVVNDDYANPLTADRVKRSFDMLFRVAEGEKPLANEYKSNIDYFNTNKQNRFYTQTGLGLTKIFKVIDGDVCPNIIMEVISEKALATRRNTPVKT